MPSVEVTVWSTVVLEGWHRWPTAPDHRSYLRDRHRHLFNITAHVAVSHDDRDVEFHDLRDLITVWWETERGAQSCEAIAQELHDHLTDNAKLTVTEVTVSEDGYDGATLRWS